MSNLRKILIIVSLVVVAGFLIIYDYSDFWSRRNLGYFLGIIAAVLNLVSVILSARREK
ncbi:MAG: hypothetical protein U0X39_11885 [Bacteroidales bacterium]